jgi:hypothetical protein
MEMLLLQGLLVGVTDGEIREDEVPNVFPLLRHGVVDDESTKYIFKLRLAHVYYCSGNVQCPATQGEIVVTRNKRLRCIVLAKRPLMEGRSIIKGRKLTLVYLAKCCGCHEIYNYGWPTFIRWADWANIGTEFQRGSRGRVIN